MIGQYEETISKYYSSNGGADTDGEGGAVGDNSAVADYYWYEENYEGGITILGPKKLRYLDTEKATAYGRQIIDAEFGEGTLDAYMEETIDSALLDQVEEAYMEFQMDIMLNPTKNEELWAAFELSKEEAGIKDNIDDNYDYDLIVLYDTSTPLPEYINGKPVTTIGKSAFEDISVFNGNFIPNTVKIINENAFDDATFISDVVIPDSVEEIRKEAFRSSNALDGVKIVINDSQGNLELIGEWAFEKSNFSGTLNLRSGINIADNAFNDADDIIVTRK